MEPFSQQVALLESQHDQLSPGGADNITTIWDVASSTKLKTLREHFGWVLSCDFAPDRSMLATASWDRFALSIIVLLLHISTVRLWDPNNGELLTTLRGHTKGSLLLLHHSLTVTKVCGCASFTPWDTPAPFWPRALKTAPFASGIRDQGLCVLRSVAVMFL